MDMLAKNDLDRLGINPIEYLNEVYKLSVQAFKDEGGHSGAAYLAVAGKAASDLASYKHPKLTAVAITEMQLVEDRMQLTTEQAIEIIKKDPFATKEVKAIDTHRVLEAMATTIESPFLPQGELINGK